MRIASLAFTAILLLALTGCAQSANTLQMVPDGVTAMSRHEATVSTSVSGGETGEDAYLTDLVFQDALDMTIDSTGIFASVVGAKQAEYHLAVRIKRLREQSESLTTASATLLTEWTLDDASGTRIWREVISRQFSTDVYDHVLPGDRARLAKEGAIRDSLRTGLERLANVSLEQGVDDD